MMMMAAVAPPRASSHAASQPPPLGSRVAPTTVTATVVPGVDVLPHSLDDYDRDYDDIDCHYRNSSPSPSPSTAPLMVKCEDAEVVGVLHPPSIANNGNHNNQNRDPNNNCFVCFSKTVSEDVDDFVLRERHPGDDAAVIMQDPCVGMWNTCGALGCWEAASLGGTTATPTTTTTTTLTTTTTTNGPSTNGTTENRRAAPGGNDRTLHLDAKMIPAATGATATTAITPRCRSPQPTAAATTTTTRDVVAPSRRSRVVRFRARADVVEYDTPATPQTTRFWTEHDVRELRHGRRELLRRFQRHVAYAPLQPWVDDDTESLRGLEDHYADMIGKTNSYYIRKRHEEVILREYRRHAHRVDPRDLTERLAALARSDSEEDVERALDRAALDERMARGVADASPVAARVLTSGEAFLHTLMVRLRDYT